MVYGAFLLLDAFDDGHSHPLTTAFHPHCGRSLTAGNRLVCRQSASCNFHSVTASAYERGAERCHAAAMSGGGQCRAAKRGPVSWPPVTRTKRKRTATPMPPENGASRKAGGGCAYMLLPQRPADGMRLRGGMLCVVWHVLQSPHCVLSMVFVCRLSSSPFSSYMALPLLLVAPCGWRQLQYRAPPTSVLSALCSRAFSYSRTRSSNLHCKESRDSAVPAAGLPLALALGECRWPKLRHKRLPRRCTSDVHDTPQN